MKLNKGQFSTGPKAVLACGARILHISNMFKRRTARDAGFKNRTLAYLPWQLSQPGG